VVFSGYICIFCGNGYSFFDSCIAIVVNGDIFFGDFCSNCIFNTGSTCCSFRTNLPDFLLTQFGEINPDYSLLSSSIYIPVRYQPTIQKSKKKTDNRLEFFYSDFLIFFLTDSRIWSNTDWSAARSILIYILDIIVRLEIEQIRLRNFFEKNSQLESDKDIEIEKKNFFFK